MRGVRVNPLGVLRVAVCFGFIERTSTEVAERTPRPRAGSAQAAGATNDHAPFAGRTPINDKSWRLRVRGADGSRATSIRAGAMPRTPETSS
jgi:hypothetical protein